MSNQTASAGDHVCFIITEVNEVLLVTASDQFRI